MENFDIYRDISGRTGGDIYVGVVGPVRTGKSTFIKKFMENVVLDNITDINVRTRAVDELPQSADGRTIMTSQPKFVPNEAVSVSFGEGVNANVRLIDCVGYLVDGALGDKEGENDRLVMTPWSDEEMPFSKAAEIGTEKVIKEHSTVAVLVTTDGTILDIDRNDYQKAEEQVASELTKIGKPFAIVLNTKTPSAPKTAELAAELEKKYNAPVVIADVLNMDEKGVAAVMNEILLEFPVRSIDVKTPKWMQALDKDNCMIDSLLSRIRLGAANVRTMKDADTFAAAFGDMEILESAPVVNLDMGKGRIELTLPVKREVFHKVLSEECGKDISDDFNLLAYVKRCGKNEAEYDKIRLALEEVRQNGYGIVRPRIEEMTLDEPQIVSKGGQYGVRLKATAPSLHIIEVDVETEVNPTVGSELAGKTLAEEMVQSFDSDKEAFWKTNLFGKTLDELASDGLNGKLYGMPAEAQQKMRKTLGRIVNEGRGGVICILL